MNSAYPAVRPCSPLSLAARPDRVRQSPFPLSWFLLPWSEGRLAESQVSPPHDWQVGLGKRLALSKAFEQWSSQKVADHLARSADHDLQRVDRPNIACLDLASQLFLALFHKRFQMTVNDRCNAWRIVEQFTQHDPQPVRIVGKVAGKAPNEGTKAVFEIGIRGYRTIIQLLHPRHDPLNHRLVQFGFRAEVVEGQSVVDARAAGDRLDARAAKSVRGKFGLGGAKNEVFGA